VACDPLVDLSLAPALDFWILSQGIDRKGEGVGSSVHSCQELNLENRGGESQTSYEEGGDLCDHVLPFNTRKITEVD
jgi:hypothetical protein